MFGSCKVITLKCFPVDKCCICLDLLALLHLMKIMCFSFILCHLLNSHLSQSASCQPATLSHSHPCHSPPYGYGWLHVQSNSSVIFRPILCVCCPISQELHRTPTFSSVGVHASTTLVVSEQVMIFHEKKYRKTIGK